MSVMRREPTLVPRKPGVFVLLNSKSRRCGYVAYTTDLQKRSHSLAHMLQNQKTHWSIAELPKAPADEWCFTVIEADIDRQRGERVIKNTEKALLAKRFRVVKGSRGAVAMVTYPGGNTRMSLTEAIQKAKCKSKYITVWRRIDRGWSVAQALELEEAPPRWDPAATSERRKRAEARAS